MWWSLIHSFIHSADMYQVLHICRTLYVRCQGFKDDKAGFWLPGAQNLLYWEDVFKVYVACEP